MQCFQSHLPCSISHNPNPRLGSRVARFGSGLTRSKVRTAYITCASRLILSTIYQVGSIPRGREPCTITRDDQKRLWKREERTSLMTHNQQLDQARFLLEFMDRYPEYHGPELTASFIALRPTIASAIAMRYRDNPSLRTRRLRWKKNLKKI
jgi:hypothetical protein